MDPEIIPMMIFTIIILAMLGGFILLLPITRRLGKFLEYRMTERTRLMENQEKEALLRAIESLRDDVAHLAERQEFTERLLDKPRSGEPPRG
ncbi:MAG TPA: hypothetical protein VJ997_15685 [Longimicrobiales bacterium]|nr:hypothetical protein [Longimicrobiales bacterium]